MTSSIEEPGENNMAAVSENIEEGMISREGDLRFRSHTFEGELHRRRRRRLGSLLIDLQPSILTIFY